MIRATEFAIGEFPLETANQNFRESLNYVRNVAQDHQLRLKDRNVQINVGAKFGAESLKISSENIDGELEIFTDPQTIAIGKAIQKALTQTFQDHPILQRKGQNIIGIEINVDRKKGLITQTKGTDFFISFDPEKGEKNLRLTSDSSAFPVHRQNTGKSGTIRLARLEDESNEAVYEVRLLANNPHAPYFDEHTRQIFNGAEVTVEIFQQYLKKELEGLKIENGEEKITIEKDGKIKSIPPMFSKDAEHQVPAPILEKAYLSQQTQRQMML
jgi:hypothetical protein